MEETIFCECGLVLNEEGKCKRCDKAPPKPRRTKIGKYSGPRGERSNYDF